MVQGLCENKQEIQNKTGFMVCGKTKRKCKHKKVQGLGVVEKQKGNTKRKKIGFRVCGKNDKKIQKEIQKKTKKIVQGLGFVEKTKQ